MYNGRIKIIIHQTFLFFILNHKDKPFLRIKLIYLFNTLEYQNSGLQLGGSKSSYASASV